jgi:ribosome-binding protein aMBF1 (putative translation factor)
MPKKTSDALEILDSLHRGDAGYAADLAPEKGRLRVGQVIRSARSEAGLTQAELAERVGTSQSVIARLEDASYEGHTLRMLERVASALGHRVEVSFVASRQ